MDSSGKRVGGFCRLEAAQAFLETGGNRCPVTNEPIAKVKEVPSILEEYLFCLYPSGFACRSIPYAIVLPEVMHMYVGHETDSKFILRMMHVPCCAFTCQHAWHKIYLHKICILYTVYTTYLKACSGFCIIICPHT